MSLLDDASLIVTPNGYKGGVTTGTLYSVKPTNGDGDMVVTRNTTSTRVDSSGFIQNVAFNAPRLDYTGGGCPRILVETQRKNEVTYSEQFNDATWLKYSATVTSNSQQAPDGTTTADLVYPLTTGALTGQVYKNITTGISLGNVVTVSAFVKASGKNFAYISAIQSSYSPAAEFNLTTGAITNISVGSTASMTAFANGWWRISVSSTAGAGLYYAVIGSLDAAGSSTNTASGTNGILVWGAQVEVGSTATSYIPTVAGTVTRNADVISKTGISSLIGQTEGTIFVEANLTANTDDRRIIVVSDGTELQRIMFWTLATTLYANFNGVSVTIGTFPIFPISTAKMVLAYTIAGGSTTYSIKLNNNILITGTAAAAPTPLTNINLGTNTNSLLNLNDRIKSVTLFKTALSPTQLANLTAI